MNTTWRYGIHPNFVFAEIGCKIFCQTQQPALYRGVLHRAGEVRVFIQFEPGCHEPIDGGDIYDDPLLLLNHVSGHFLGHQKISAQMKIQILAEKSTVSSNMISRIERGLTIPSVEILMRLATVFDKSINYFVEDVSTSHEIVHTRPGGRDKTVYDDEHNMHTESFTSGLRDPQFMSFLIVFLLAGLVFAAIAFTISVIAVPMIIHRGVTVSTAISTSIRAVKTNPMPMFRWAATIAVLIAVGLGLFFVGLAIALPIIGHASWHAYREIVIDNE